MEINNETEKDGSTKEENANPEKGHTGISIKHRIANSGI